MEARYTPAHAEASKNLSKRAAKSVGSYFMYLALFFVKGRGLYLSKKTVYLIKKKRLVKSKCITLKKYVIVFNKHFLEQRHEIS